MGLKEPLFKQKTPNAQPAFARGYGRAGYPTPNAQLGKNCDYAIIQCISLDPESNMEGQRPSTHFFENSTSRQKRRVQTAASNDAIILQFFEERSDNSLDYYDRGNRK